MEKNQQDKTQELLNNCVKALETLVVSGYHNCSVVAAVVTTLQDVQTILATTNPIAVESEGDNEQTKNTRL